MLGGLLYPAFVFLDFSVEFKVIVMSLYCMSMVNNCYVIAVSNDSFIANVSRWDSPGTHMLLVVVLLLTRSLCPPDQIKVLTSSIHHVMPFFEGFDLKNNLANFLILNSEHQRLSFTYLHAFDYSTDSLIGTTLHSVYY